MDKDQQCPASNHETWHRGVLGQVGAISEECRKFTNRLLSDYKDQKAYISNFSAAGGY